MTRNQYKVLDIPEEERLEPGLSRPQVGSPVEPSDRSCRANYLVEYFVIVRSTASSPAHREGGKEEQLFRLRGSDDSWTELTSDNITIKKR